MKSHWKLFLIAFGAILIVIFGAAVTAHRWPQRPSNTDPRTHSVRDTLPPVVSLIPGIEVISAFIDADGQAKITIMNKTGKAIIGVGSSCGNVTFTDDNGVSQDNPTPLIARGGSYTAQQPISNLRADQPIRISAVFYDDGSEGGDAAIRKNIHEERERQGQRRAAEKQEKSQKSQA